MPDLNNIERTAMEVERERTAPQFYSQKIFELMRGNGNQSGINDPQPSNPDA
jgi:hypothetical protein